MGESFVFSLHQHYMLEIKHLGGFFLSKSTLIRKFGWWTTDIFAD
jgi:hypothetical protein